MLEKFGNFFKKKTLDSYLSVIEQINEIEDEIKILRDEEIISESLKLKEQAQNGVSLDLLLPRAFALSREVSKRTLGQRPYDVQLIGGMVLHKGAVAEMMTGEGKTLAAVAPAYLNALQGKGVHIVTVNEYLARRDAVWMGQIYNALGLSVSCLVPEAAYIYDPLYKAPEEDTKKKNSSSDFHESVLLDKERDTTGSFMVQQEFLRPVSRREAYLADVTYGTNNEFGFDYLRDNLVYNIEDQVQREHHFAIIDEVDSILIDEARTPLIIAAPDTESSNLYKTFSRIASTFKKGEDFEVDEKRKAVSITDAGISKVESILGIQNIYAPENIQLVHYLEESVKAVALFFKDRDYVVKDGEVVIVDEFTGRTLHGRRYQAGLHQAIEAKEGVLVKEESKTYAKISIQNYFRMYKKISGMTGTAQTSAEEFYKVYNLDVVSVPTNKPLIRKDEGDVIYRNFSAKVNAVVRDVKERQKKGQPVLLGTTSITKNEIFSAALANAGVKYEVLNAKNNEREGAIIAQAGRLGAVTVATNMAGRGVDIILGGNPPDSEEAKKVKELGGLHIIGTERHEARRIDNQLKGRAGRQGDPGSSQFFLSLEDDLLRIFGGDRIKNLMERFDLPEEEPINFSFVSKAVEQAQRRVEGANFDMRKHLLEYDDVLNRQRTAVYKKRNEILKILNKEDLGNFISGATLSYFDRAYGQISPEQVEEVKRLFEESGLSRVSDLSEVDFSDPESCKKVIEEKAKEAGNNPLAKNQLISVLDMLWMNNLEDLEALSESVGLRAYGQKDPLVEYRHEASKFYSNFWNNFNAIVFMNVFKLIGNSETVEERPKQKILDSKYQNVGRNDPCPCGSGKKFKHCHGANL